MLDINQKKEVLNDRAIERREAYRPDLLARALEKRGIKVRQVPTPKDFVRVIFPGIPPALWMRSVQKQKRESKNGGGDQV